QVGGRDSTPPQRTDLVLHQRDERRDYEREPRAEERGHLIAERLPGTRREHRQDVASREQRAEHFELVDAKPRVTETVLEDRAGGVESAVERRHVSRNSVGVP